MIDPEAGIITAVALHGMKMDGNLCALWADGTAGGGHGLFFGRAPAGGRK